MTQSINVKTQKRFQLQDFKINIGSPYKGRVFLQKGKNYIKEKIREIQQEWIRYPQKHLKKHKFIELKQLHKT